MFHFTIANPDNQYRMPRVTHALILWSAVFFATHEVAALTECSPVTVNAPSAGALLQATIETEVCNQVKSKFQTANLGPVMGYMAKAYAASSKGAVADYATNMQVFALGAGVTVAVNNITPAFTTSELTALKNRFSSGTLPDAGAGVVANASLGVSFKHMPFKRRGWFDPKKINVYASFFLLPTMSFDVYSLKSTSASAYIQYKLLPMRKIPFGLMTWGGLDVGLGYSYASTTTSVSSTTKITSVEFETNGKRVVYEPTGTLAITYTSHVVPLEVSTNFSLLYFLSFVVGGAADFHILSSAEIAANISGVVKVDGVSTSDDYARFSMSETGKASAVGFRTFFGPQFNIWKIRIFTLAHITNDASYAVTTGARFVW